MALFNARHMLDILLVILARAGAALGGLLFAYVVSNWQGLAALGLVTVFLSVVVIASFFAKAGVDMALTREMGRSDFADFDSHTAFRVGLKACAAPLVLTVIVGAGVLAAGVFDGLTPRDAVAFAVVLPCVVASLLRAGILRGMGQSGRAALFEVGSISGLAAVFLALGLIWGWSLGAIAAFVASGVFFALLAWLPILQPMQASGPQRPARDLRLHGSVYFMLTGLSVFALQAGSFAIAGPFLTPESVGELRVIERLSLLISFPMVAISSYIAPQAAKLREQTTQSTILGLWLRASVMSLLLSLPVTALLLVAPDLALTLFGVEPTAQLVAMLRAVCLATLIYAALAPASMIANMIGLERNIAGVSVVLLILGIPAYVFASIWFAATGFVWVYCLVLLGQAGRHAWILLRADRRQRANSARHS